TPQRAGGDALTSGRARLPRLPGPGPDGLTSRMSTPAIRMVGRASTRLPPERCFSPPRRLPTQAGRRGLLAGAVGCVVEVCTRLVLGNHPAPRVHPATVGQMQMDQTSELRVELTRWLTQVREASALGTHESDWRPLSGLPAWPCVRDCVAAL